MLFENSVPKIFENIYYENSWADKFFIFVFLFFMLLYSIK